MAGLPFYPSRVQYPERLNCAAAFLDRWVDEEEAMSLPHQPGRDAHLPGASGAREPICNVLVDKLGFVPGNRVLLRSANNR